MIWALRSERDRALAGLFIQNNSKIYFASQEAEI